MSVKKGKSSLTKRKEQSGASFYEENKKGTSLGEPHESSVQRGQSGAIQRDGKKSGYD